MASKVDSYHSAIVVGAGCAGLYAAQQLKEQYPDVLVVDAQNHVGGRVRQASYVRTYFWRINKPMTQRDCVLGVLCSSLAWQQ